MVLHLDLSVESDAGNLYLARLLREDDILFPDGCAIVPAINAFVLERHLCRPIKFLDVTTVHLGHFARDLLDIHKCVELVSQHHSFLFVDFLSVSSNGHVEVASADLT